MQIKKTKEIQALLKRLEINMYEEHLNQFLDAYVPQSTEASVIKALAQAGAREFDSPNPPSLYIRADEWENSPYHRTVQLYKIKSAQFKYKKECIDGLYLFNADAIQPDPDRELKDWMKLRALDRDTYAIYLYQGRKDWMMDAPSEAATNDGPALAAHGRVLTFGLGIGYYLFMALRNPAVESVTVVERSQEVIDLFKSSILPQFHTDKPVHFIQNDAFACWNKEFLSSFDSIYVDIWQSQDDGLQCIRKLLQIYEPPASSTSFWIEDSCITPVRTLLALHFMELTDGMKRQTYPEYEEIMESVRVYFRSIPDTVQNAETLRHYMYDRETLRHILAQPI